MAIVLEQQTDQTFAGNGSTTEFNMVATIPAGSDLGLLVLVSWLNDDLESISSLVWDPEGQNEALTLIGDYWITDDSRVEAWYYHGPTAGAAKNIEVIFSAAPLSTTDIVVCAYALSGAHPTAAVRQYHGDEQATASVMSAVLSSALSGDFLAGCGTIEASQTADWDSSTVTMTTVVSDSSQPSHSHAHGFADGAGETLTLTWSAADHTAMIGVAIIPGAAGPTYKMEGVTKNLAGAALGSCHCFLVKHTGGSTMEYLDYTLSNASTGVYSFTGIVDNDSEYLVIAWKDDTPHVFDATDYVLTPVVE